MAKEKKETNQQMEEEVEQETIEETSAEAELSQPSQEELLQEQLNVLNDKYMRVLAEYDNYRKRSQKEKDEIYPRATADTVEKFLPIIDNFERAMGSECSDETFKKGMDMIFQSFLKTLEAFQVEVIGEEGIPFDPTIHNAVMHVEDDAYGESEVIQVLQKGYRIGERVVRYAMVKVAN